MKEKTDDLLDRALADYCEQPRHGLEDRVLHRVRSAGQRRKWAIPIWVCTGLAALTCLLLFVSVVIPTRVAIFVPKPKPDSETRATASIVVSKITPLMPVAPVIPHEATRRMPLPKQDVFPTPMPVAAWEKALAELSRRPPFATSVASNVAVDPIEIAPLEIRPLTSDSSQ